MRLGIFGGTFNPIHYGHLINAEIVRSDFQLDKIIFVPARSPVHKELSGSVTAEERCTMISLAISGEEEYEVSRIEIDRESPSYTIQTVDQLKILYPDSTLYLIIGMDSLAEMHTWKEYGRLLKSVSVIVLRRPTDEKIPDFDSGESDIQVAENPVIDLSSTRIRERIAQGKSVRFMVPDTVFEFINDKGLYRD